MAAPHPGECIDGIGGVDSLNEQIYLAKQELNCRFKNFHRALFERELAVMAELDAILKSAGELREKKKNLKQTQEELKKKRKKKKGKEYNAKRKELLEAVTAQVSEVEHLVCVSEKGVVELEWKDSEVFAAILQSCVVVRRELTFAPNPVIPSIQNAVPYAGRQTPVWSVATTGSRDGQLDGTRCLTVDEENEDIYIADEDNDRVVVFNRNGLFVRNLTVKGMRWPYGIAVVPQFCYISSTQANGPIIKANKITGEKLASIDPGITMIALTLDKETGMLFVCPLFNNSIWFIQPDRLEKVSELTLHTPHFKRDTTKLHDMKTQKEEIYILFHQSPYPLQSFGRDGNLLRTIIPLDSIGRILYFCIDLQQNFIVSDNFADKVFVLSPTGEIIATIGKDDSGDDEPGELYGPRGVGVLENGRIVVCDGKTENMLQLF